MNNYKSLNFPALAMSVLHKFSMVIVVFWTYVQSVEIVGLELGVQCLFNSYVFISSISAVRHFTFFLSAELFLDYIKY